MQMQISKKNQQQMHQTKSLYYMFSFSIILNVLHNMGKEICCFCHFYHNFLVICSLNSLKDLFIKMMKMLI